MPQRGVCVWGGAAVCRATVRQETNRSDSSCPQVTGKRKHEAPLTGAGIINVVAATLLTSASSVCFHSSLSRYMAVKQY